ncbi:MAG TPA: hypothetical protein VGM90_19040 [Kofleriaceae bacterium]
MKNFLIDALTSALELGLATPDDVMKHVTPEILGTSLPRPLWSRLLIACLGAPKVDAQLVIETVGVQNLCEHVPAPIIFTIVASVAVRTLGGIVPDRPVRTFDSAAAAAPLRATTPLNLSAPPPPEARAERSTPPPPPGPSIPTPSTTPDPDADDASKLPLRARTPTGQRFRQTNTNIGRLASSTRRPQASAGAAEPSTPPKRRAETEVEEVVEEGAKTSDDWRSSLAVEDDQLVDWSASEETQTSTEERKR